MLSSVPESYAGKTIFITGCTGFLGKVLLEKLLYSCPDVKKVYILLRAKRGMTAPERLMKILQLPVFSRLNEEKPGYLAKIEPLNGDVSQDDLGMTPEDQQLLIDEVSIVFHTAATVNFNDPLHVSLNVNVKGTERILNICKRMKKLQVFVHVSTVYSNTHQIFIEEEVYSPPVPLSMVNQLIEEQPDEERTKTILGDHPNQYTFSKSLAEALVADTHGHVPVIIVRPSIIFGSQSDPIPGWIDCWNAATYLLAGISKGIIRVLPGKRNNILDIIPVDYVANLIVVAATKKVSPDDTIIYNCATSTENPLTLDRLQRLNSECTQKHKINVLPLSGLQFTEHKYLLSILSATLQTSPMVLADTCLKISGKEPKYKKTLSKLEQVRSNVAFFTTHSWKFSTKNNFSLFASLSQSDQATFPFSPSLINWTEYIPIHFSGIVKYLLKNQPANTS